MSYDLEAFPLPPGSDPEEALEALEEEEDVDRSPTEREREWMRGLAAALRAAAPELEAAELDDVVELSQERFEVSVFAGQAGIAIPYWFDGAEALEVLKLALGCASVLREAGGLAVWDPQLGSLLDEHTPVSRLAEAYAIGREQVRRLE